MSDSLERLYQAVIAAKDLDPATSRTAKLFQRGPSKTVSYTHLTLPTIYSV